MALDDFINTDENFPKSSCQTLAKQNLTQSKRGAIKSLREDNFIIIKEAAKGRASVIINKDYETMVEAILNDETYCKE